MQTIVPCVTEIDLAAASDFEAQLHAFDPSEDLVVDLATITYCDSAGLAVLVRARTRHQAGSGSFTVTNPQPIVATVLAITGLSQVLLAPAAEST